MRDGVCRASVATLAARLNMDTSTIRRHLKTLTDSGYLQDLTPGLRNRPHIYQPGSKFTRKPAPEPILPDVNDDTEDIPLTGMAENTSNFSGGSAENISTSAENTSEVWQKA